MINKSHLTYSKWSVVVGGLLLLLAVTFLFALQSGAEPVGIGDAFGGNAKAYAILFVSRLPRILLAAFVGMALATSGGAYQALLRNPLADPFILGVSGGAALGSVVAVGFGLPFTLTCSLAFLTAMASMFAIFWVSRTGGRLPPTTLLLTGVIFNAFCFALILFVNAVVPMEQAYEILTLLIGNLEVTDIRTVVAVGAFVLVGFLGLCAISWRMNLLTLGDDEATALGVDMERVRFITFASSSLMVGAAVAVSGLIGFVGLFVPHIIRMVFGADHRLLIPASGIGGAVFLVAADTIARTLFMNTSLGTELPVGVVTALIGAPLFVFLLRKTCLNI